MNVFEMLEDWGTQLFGLKGYTGKGGLHHNLNQLLDINNPRSLLGSIAHPTDSFIANPEKTYKHWIKQLQGGGGGGDESRSASSAVSEIIPEEEITISNTLNLDPGLDEDDATAPMFTDVSMVASRSKARRNLGALGYDTGTSKGRSIEERKNKRMGTALTRSMA